MGNTTTRRLRATMLAGAVTALLAPAAAGAAEPPPGAAISDSLEYVGKIADTQSVISGKFDTVKGRELLVVDGEWGLRTIDISDPRRPRVLDSLLPDDLAEDGFWEGEDLDIDPSRRLAFLSLDPRHDDKDPAATGCTRGSTANPACRSGIYVISYADPEHLKQVGDFIPVPAGHTTTCIEHCRYLWTGGPARAGNAALADLGPLTPGGRGDGRPIWVTDMRHPKTPYVFETPIDLYRNDGLTDYTHDVQVDDEGIAWASGRGGVRGYATRGAHVDPVTGERRPATPWNPILVAGGGVGGVSTPEAMFMHNSWHPTDGKVRAAGVKPGNILIGTEEQFNRDCASDGRLVFSDLTDSRGGEPALSSTPENPYRMKALSTWHPMQNTPETVGPGNSCSAHYFDVSGGTLAQGWYQQGTRILDVSDARNPYQIGYFRVRSDGSADNPSSNTWGAMFHDGLIWVIDRSRGVEILRLKAPPEGERKHPSVVAPSLTAADPYAQQVVGNQALGLVCPLFQDSPAAVAAGQSAS